MTLPTDLVYQKIPAAPLRTPLNLEVPPNNPDIEAYVLDEIVKRVEEANGDLAFLVDACALRHHVVGEVRDLVRTTGFPVYSAPMGKSIVPEDYERFGGVGTTSRFAVILNNLFCQIYNGENTRPDILQKVEQAQLIISIGSLQSDFNTGNFTYHLPLTATIEVSFYPSVPPNEMV